MTIAEIHGKLSRSGRNLSDRMEDLLTSDVFSACRYLQPESLLLPFLRRARIYQGNTLTVSLKSALSRADLRFWPRFPGCEPDVLISVESESGYDILMVEAKYFSAKSSAALMEEELELATAPRDQLAREYQALHTAHTIFGLSSDAITARALIYLTAHRSMPLEEISESCHEISKLITQAEPIHLYWLSWFELHTLVRKAREAAASWEQPILEDLQALLERKRLLHYRGIRLDTNSAIQPGTVYSQRPIRRDAVYKFDLSPESPHTSPFIYHR